MSAKEKSKGELDPDLVAIANSHDSIAVRIELLLIQILRQLKKK